MTLPTLIRVFFAIDLSLTTKTKLECYIHLLKKKSRTHSIRWTKPTNFHITLQFLANIHSEHLSEIYNCVYDSIAEKKPNSILLTIGKPQLFPTPYRPRVIVLEIHPQKELAHLAALIGQGIKKANYETDPRPFRGHLTLGRIKHHQGVNLQFLSDIEPPLLEAERIEKIHLFRSEPADDGSQYTILDTISLTELHAHTSE